MAGCEFAGVGLVIYDAVAELTGFTIGRASQRGVFVLGSSSEVDLHDGLIASCPIWIGLDNERRRLRLSVLAVVQIVEPPMAPPAS